MFALLGRRGRGSLRRPGTFLFAVWCFSTVVEFRGFHPQLRIDL